MRVTNKDQNNSSKSNQVRIGFLHKQQGQSLIEVAVIVAAFALVMLYAVDFAYFYLVSSSLSSSSRTAAEYSVQGFSSVSHANLPVGGPTTTPTSISALAINDLTSLAGSSTTTSVEVCTNSITNTTASCTNYGASAAVVATDLDPEGFPLNRVDVIYTIKPPIPLGIIGSIIPTKFHRIVEMRTIN